MSRENQVSSPCPRCSWGSPWRPRISSCHYSAERIITSWNCRVKYLNSYNSDSYKQSGTHKLPPKWRQKMVSSGRSSWYGRLVTSGLDFFLAKPSTPIKGNLHWPHILLSPQEPWSRRQRNPCVANLQQRVPNHFFSHSQFWNIYQFATPTSVGC